MFKFAKSNRFEKYEIHLLEHGKEKGLYRKLKKNKKERKIADIYADVICLV